MEGIQCVVEETQADTDRKLKTSGRLVEEEKLEEEHGGGLEEYADEGDNKDDNQEHGGGSVTERVDDDDDDSSSEGEGWYEDGVPRLPFLGYRPPRQLHCTLGARFTMDEAYSITWSQHERNGKILEKWCDMANNNETPLPPVPLDILPRINEFCVSGHRCYHKRYWTDVIEETAPTHPDFRPCEMMQIFSLRLSSPLEHPVNIYGTAAVRDCWEPLPNYLFKCSRDDPATISLGCSLLPLRSPCRGIYLLQHILMDIDLWIKEDDGSGDKQLFRGYVELDAFMFGFGHKCMGRFHGDCHSLDMHFAFLTHSVETMIEIIAEAQHPSAVKISALTSGLNDEIALYDDIFCGTGVMVKHVIAVNRGEKIDVLLKLDGSLYKWTFEGGGGVIVAPDRPFSSFAQYFVLNVSFRARGRAASAWQWSCISNDISINETCP
ncbi:hypothetical protein QOZ80_1AG0022440 [Eleusine coracana subsp. coracana]|nr:hypothetical protein QOZ80_1AG0022440 [Eleusine coracana subsp. coracana]